MDNVENIHEAVLSHKAMFGTVDSWLIWVRAVAVRYLLCDIHSPKGLLFLINAII